MSSPKSPEFESRKWKKGQSGNPLGGKIHNKDVRMIKRLTSAEVAEIGTLILSKNLKKLQAIVNDALKNDESKHSAMKVWIARVAIKGITKGDANALDVLLNRLVGKVKEEVEVSGKGGGPIQNLVGTMSPAERKVVLAKLRKSRAAAGED